MPILGFVVTIAAAYLLGSLPTGFLMARARGVDIRTVGSGNIGATNAFRILGKRIGVFVLLVDALKGWAAVQIVAPVVLRIFPGTPPTYLAIAAGIAVIAGHNYTCWLRFRGGKGVATSAGVLAALVPWALLIVLGIWVILFVTTRYVSLGSISAAFVLPFATWLTAGHDVALIAFTSAIGVMVIYRHRRNIQRLIEGTENRIEFKKKEAAS